MIAVTCPHCGRTREVVAATALIAPCVRCARNRATLKARPIQPLSHLVKRATDVVNALRHLDAMGMQPNYRHVSDLDALERQVAALASAIWARQLAA